MLLVSCLILYGDVFLPIRRLAMAQELLVVPATKLMLHCVVVWNNVRKRAVQTISLELLLWEMLTRHGIVAGSHSVCDFLLRCAAKPKETSDASQTRRAVQQELEIGVGKLYSSSAIFVLVKASSSAM